MRRPQVVWLVTLILSFVLSAVSSEGACPPAPHSGRWAQKNPMPVENSEFATAVLNGMIYAAGGYLMENHILLFIYNPRTDTWQKGPDLQVGTHHAGVVAVNGKLYVMGGEFADDLVQIFDPVTKAWSRGRPIPRSCRAVVPCRNGRAADRRLQNEGIRKLAPSQGSPEV